MRALLLSLTMLLSVACAAAEQEPPTQLRITLDGKQVITTMGAKAEFEVGGRKVMMRVEELPWRQFVQGSLKFEYPRHFPWEFDASPPRTWTLDGNDATIMLIENPGEQQSLDDFAKGFERIFKGNGTMERVDQAMKTAKVGTLHGLGMRYTIATTRMSMEAFALGKGERSWLLVLQDALGDDGKHSSEYVDMRTHLTETLEF